MSETKDKRILALREITWNYFIEECLFGESDIEAMRKAALKLKQERDHLRKLQQKELKGFEKIHDKATLKYLTYITKIVKNSHDSLEEAVIQLDKKTKEAEQYLNHLKTNRKLKNGKEAFPVVNEFFLKFSSTRRKQDAALNFCLFRMKGIFGGVTKLYNALKSDSRIVPKHLGASYSIDTIRKRIETHEKNLLKFRANFK